jgi:hypothetical protein
VGLDDLHRPSGLAILCKRGDVPELQGLLEQPRLSLGAACTKGGEIGERESLAPVVATQPNRRHTSNHDASSATLPAAMLKKLSPALARQTWRKANAVCFDVDSTVVTEEGIDVLAAYCGAGEAVAELTRKAMGGSLAERLALVKPTQSLLDACLREHPLSLTPGMKQLADALHSRGKHV